MKIAPFVIPGLVLAAAVQVRADPLKVGDPAPAVTGTTEAGAKLDLAGVYGKQAYTLVYFFPRAFTSGCTREGCSLRDAYQELLGKGVAVIGVSTDTMDRQAKFKAAENFPFTLIADPDQVVIRAFGVPTRDIPGIGAIAMRQSYLIKDGKVVWCDYHASTSQQASDVLAALAGLAKDGGAAPSGS